MSMTVCLSILTRLKSHRWYVNAFLQIRTQCEGGQFNGIEL